MSLYLIGFDGATWNLLDLLLADGRMPHLQALIEQGARAGLQSTWPPVTALAWPSFYTGRNAGKHGVFSFVRLDEAGQERVVDARSVHGPALWDLASAAGLRTGVAGVPVTYPARPTNGFLITDFLTPPQGGADCYPPGLLDEFNPWVFHVPPVEGTPEPENTRAFVSNLTAVASRQFEALSTLLDRYRPELFVGVWMHTDTLQHTHWGYLDPGHPFYNRPEAAALREEVMPVFAQLDAFAGELASRVLPDGNLLVVSDHGFGAMHRRIALNNALARHGFLALKQGRLLLSRLQRRAQRQLAGWWEEADELRHVKRNQAQQAYVDWPRTRAFAGALHELCVHLNRTDRYPHGTVRPEDVEPLARDVTDMLLALADDEGKLLIAQVYRPEDLYAGPFTAQAPDLILRPAHPGDVFTDGLLRRERVWRWESGHAGGWHRREGILVAAGAAIRHPQAWTAPPSLLDVAPTALALLDLQPPADMDGRVLAEMLAAPAAPLRPIPAVAPARPAGEMDMEEEAALTERLRGLGYLG